MILIDGNHIKRKYLQICEDLVNNLMKKINSILIQKNIDLQRDIGLLMDSISINPENEELLVQVERNLERLKLKDQKIVNDEFEDIIKWQSLFFT